MLQHKIVAVVVDLLIRYLNCALVQFPSRHFVGVAVVESVRKIRRSIDVLAETIKAHGLKLTCYLGFF